MEHDKVVSEARARIIWGDPALSVRDFLIANGVSDTVADAKIKEFLLERNKEIKSSGVRNTLTGLVLAAAREHSAAKPQPSADSFVRELEAGG